MHVYDDAKLCLFDKVCLLSFPNSNGAIFFTDNSKHIDRISVYP